MSPAINQIIEINLHSSNSAICATHLKLPEPFLPLISFLFTKGQVDKLFVAVLSGSKWNHVLLHMAEILSSVGVTTGTQTL